MVEAEFVGVVEVGTQRLEGCRYIHADPDLAICDGIAQTGKHYQRNWQLKKDPITAKVHKLYSDSPNAGARGEIAWSSQSGKAGTEDVLDLAQRCTDAWQRFFQQHGLDPNV